MVRISETDRPVVPTKCSTAVDDAQATIGIQQAIISSMKRSQLINVELVLMKARERTWGILWQYESG